MALRASILHCSRRFISCVTASAAGETRGPRVRVLQQVKMVPAVYPVREMAKKTKNKPDKKKEQKIALEDIIDDIEDEDENEGFEKESFKETELSKFMSDRMKGKKTKGSSNMKYDEFVNTVEGELLWQELQDRIDRLKHIYQHQFSLRSATSLDELQILFEGDKYPLNEIASISKKDPKKLIIDASAFPQAAQNIMTAIRDSGMNLNPQQEGLTIFVPIPKVTKEFRERLAGGAKKKLTECKDDLRKVQNKFSKKVSERELAGELLRDDCRASLETIKAVTDHFFMQGDQLSSAKLKDILGK